MRSSLSFPFSRTTLALGLAVALSGCAGMNAATNVSSTEPSRLQGEITSSSPINVNDGSRYQSFYLNLKAGELVRVRQTGALENAVLTLVDDRGQLVGGPSQGSLHLAPETTGKYRLGVSGGSDNGYGPFTLELDTITAQNGGDLQVDESVFGLLSRNQNANDYQLTVGEAGLYEINLGSSELDTVLKLSGGGLELENDDTAQSTDSQLVTQLQPGITYTVTATALDQPPEGTYDLQVGRKALPEGVELTNGGEISVGQTINGLADSGEKHYRINITERALLRVNMSSSDVDSYLKLQGPGVNAEDDDSGDNYDAQITALVQPGNYRISASTVNGAAGLFTLTSSVRAVSSRSDRVRPGEAVAGRLRGDQGSQVTLVISEPGFYQVDLVSSDFDAVLHMEGQGMDLEDDDGAGGTNSRIGRYLDAGSYRLTAKSYENGKTGDYVLSVEQTDEG